VEKKLIMRFILLVLLLFVGQQTSLYSQVVDKKNRFEEFQTSNEHLFQQKDIVHKYAESIGIPIKIELENGRVADLQFFDKSGHPTYYTVFNTGSAITTGTNDLNPGGELGLNLTGKGMTVGVYDQTRPKPDHVEFEDRLTQIDGSTEDISNHATHVTGTILAAGINPGVRGMAYESTGWAFNWDADLSKMNANAYDPISKPNGHLVSNHSYGFVIGWFRNSSGSWVWSGNSSVDPDEDYRFGFYSSKSKGLDDLAFTKPFYTIVWAAGNDRNDTGDGSRNPDGPDDSIGPEGVAKNIITVGAVSGIQNYTGPEDVQISSFSSWGPTDDGRIKPDIVGVGVGVFSSAIADGGASDSYASLNGTSMAAPNITGSLLLLQQLYGERNNGRFMRSSSLKALMVNTSKEAGNHPGPDYIYGWGLLDAKAAAEVILNENGSSDFIREEVLSQGNTFEYEFLSDGVTPIRSTIAWIDPSGNPVGPSLDPTDLMLINDLDMRIIDEEGNTYFPWTLNPENGPSARGMQDKDNFRDNIEQIWVPNPKAQRYRLIVSHKGELAGGEQNFSLVFTAGTIDGAEETLYWIGGAEGSWNDGNNWSLTAQGSPAGKIPSNGTRVVFEGTEGGNTAVNLSASVNAFSVNLFGDQVVTFDLGGNNINVTNGFRVSNQITEIRNGTLTFENELSNSQIIEFGQTAFENVRLNFNTGNWRLIAAEKLGDVRIDEANLEVALESLEVNLLEMVGAGSIDGSFTSITFEEDFIAEPQANIKSDIKVIFTGENGLFNQLASENITELEVQSGELTLLSAGVDKITASNSTVLLDREVLTISELDLGEASTFDLGPSGQLTILDNISVDATSDLGSKIQAGNEGKIIHNVYRKYCFENLSLENVDLEGDAIINLGLDAEITNSEGWIAQNCEDVLFADFSFQYPCAGAAVTFENLSEGAISNYRWDFGGLGESELENPIFVFDSPGSYVVQLTISNSSGDVNYELPIEISSNDLTKPTVVVNGSNLTSQQPGSSYQWYLNGELIPGATNRSLSAESDGSYQVAIFNDICNRVSDPVVISSIPDQEQDLARFGIFVGPIPSEDKVTVYVSNTYRGPLTLSLVDMAGREYRRTEVGKNTDELEIEMNLPGRQGLYLLKINTNNLTLHKKVIKQ